MGLKQPRAQERVSRDTQIRYSTAANKTRLASSFTFFRAAYRTPYKDWVLPAAIRRRLASADDGSRQMVDILNAVLIDGLLPKRLVTVSIPLMSQHPGSTSFRSTRNLRS
jgi:hypothetical protein